MALITMPSTPAFSQSEFGIRRLSVVSESPFTGAQQIQQYPKAQWYATLTLPPMKRDLAAEWHAFFLKCEGRTNTFLLGDPDAKQALGTQGNCTTAAAASATATQININMTTNTRTLLAGSYIQLGSGASARLYMVVTSKTGDGLMDIQPPLKDGVNSGATITVTNPQGVFRLDSNDVSWSADYMSRYGITFSCSEAL